METERINKISWIFILLLAVWLLLPSQARALQDSDCLKCHGDPTLSVKVEGKVRQLYVEGKGFASSVHAQNGCISCHMEAKVEEFPHPSRMKKVRCGYCHYDIENRFNASRHGQLLARGKKFAPGCPECHTKHNIRSKKDPESPTYIMNVPATCGKCHEESSEMVKRYKEDISQHDILTNYSQSIHGEGLFRKGLIVSAACSSCHTSHDIYPYDDPRSSIHRDNIIKTCLQCHANISKVHTKIIRGELWQTAPGKIPVCVECHAPHKIRRVFYTGERMEDEVCMECHSNPRLAMKKEGKVVSLYVDTKDVRTSIHGFKGVPCVKCHFNIHLLRKPICKDSGPVDCSVCHAEQVEQFGNSIHGHLLSEKNPNAPSCKTCHGKHDTLSRKDIDSPTFARNVPDLCARCHREGERAAKVYKGKQHEIIEHYKMSIHGKGLLESGLMVVAMCTSCHTAHNILPSKISRSTVNRENIIETCSQCHLGIAEKYKESVHSKLYAKTDKELPICIDCHKSHTVRRVDKPSFRQEIVEQCGYCHKEVTETYFETYHGKASLLIGGEKTAKCSDCHGSHDILPTTDLKSSLSRKNIIETCKKCHKKANRKFVGYLSHATHHDKEKYPYLYYTFWAMTGLVVGTLTFFGLHTLFWVPQSFRQRLHMRRRFKELKSSLFTLDDISDYKQFLSMLKKEGESPDPSPGNRIWDFLDDKTKDCINEVLSEGEEPTLEQKSCIIEALNILLTRHDLYRDEHFSDIQLGEEAKRLLKDIL